jgi:hypothetical protein
MEFPNRKQRRLWEKQAGMLEKKRKATFKEQMEISKRASEVGKQIHLRNVERDLIAREEELKKQFDDRAKELMEQGMTLEQATEALRKDSED